MAHDKGSFDYKVIDEKIRKILDARSELNNTVQVAMPFVKATTTIKLPEFLGEGNVGFTLGIHGFDKDLNYEDIYSSQDGHMPLIGYTYQPSGKSSPVYAFDPNKEISSLVASTFDSRASLYSSTDFTRVPPPGITRVNIGRVKNGVLAQGQIDISVPSLAQLESLHRTFLIPGVGMVLEWGQQFAPEINPSVGEDKNISDYLFPWNNPPERDKLLTQLAKKEIGYQDILEMSAYKSNGQYMWMFGRVANFSTKTAADGSFQCTVKIVGPSQDSWAYSIKNTIVPPKDKSTQVYCAANTTSIYTYFTDTAAGGTNFKSLLDKVKNGSIPELADWKNHVQFFAIGNKTDGDPKTDTQSPTTNQNSFADAQEAYFMTWRFFVNVVLNNKTHGIRSLFSKAGISDAVIDTIGLLLPYGHGESRDINGIAKMAVIDDPIESFVGMNDYLRSVDPSTLIIVNETAAQLAANNPQYNVPGVDVKILDKTDDSKMFTDYGIGTFDQSAQNYFGKKEDNTTAKDRGFLSTGVWINHKAVVESMISADTVIRGISTLLERMSAATLNYWQLTVDPVESTPDKPHPANYMVVDANFRESSDRAVNKFLDKVHIFNKYIRQDNSTGKIIGSELLECNIDLSLPQRLFTQIATLGLVQKQDILAAAQKEQKVGDPVVKAKPGDPDYTKFTAAKISDPNDTLRKMFGITTLSAKDKNGQGPDLTILPEGTSDLIKGVCGKANVQVPGALGGQGYQAGGINPEEVPPPNVDAETLKKLRTDAEKKLTTDICKKCEQARPATKFTNEVPKTWDQVQADVKRFNELVKTPEYQALIKRNPNGSQVWERELQVAENSALVSVGLSTFPNSGGHKENSAHNVNQAIDISVHSEEARDKVKQFWSSIGGYEVIDEYYTGGKYHIHLEWDMVKVATKPEIKLTDTEKAQCGECDKARQVINQVNSREEETRTIVENKVRQFYGMQRAFRYVEIFPDYMIATIAGTADGIFANAFGASPGSLSIAGDLTLPGIAGFRIGELFWIDRIPAFYKAFGAFQIISLEDTIDGASWKTSIHARFNYLGVRWKEAMAKRLGVTK